MCKHDKAYVVENESNGGVGCPLCYSERRKEQFTAGFCPDCGRDLRTDMRDVDPWTLCDKCKEQYDDLNDCDIPLDGSTPQSVIKTASDSMWQESRDAAF